MSASGNRDAWALLHRERKPGFKVRKMTAQALSPVDLVFHVDFRPFACLLSFRGNQLCVPALSLRMPPPAAQLALRFLCLFSLGIAAANLTRAQALTAGNSAEKSSSSKDQSPESQTPATPPPTIQRLRIRSRVFPHSETGRYWISGQANIILQWHPIASRQSTAARTASVRARERNVQGLHALSRLPTHAHHRRCFSMSKAPAATASATRWAWRDSRISTWCAIPLSAIIPISRG